MKDKKEKYRVLISEIHVDSFLHNVKEEFQEDFLEKMYKLKVNMEREQIGDNKSIHINHDKGREIPPHY